MGAAAQFGSEVSVTPLEEHGWPLFVQPTDPALGADPDVAVAWLRAATPALRAALGQAGAVVLRGFAITDTPSFGRLIEHLPPLELGYAGGTTTRRNLGGRVYEATAAPVGDTTILLHQEMGYSSTYPTVLAFFCKTPATTGGATTLGAIGAIEAQIPTDLLHSVRARGVLYRRHLRAPGATTGHPLLDAHHKTWTDSFYTEDRSEVETICRATGLTWQWLDDGSLMTDCLTEGFSLHPVTGERHWFNHIHPMASMREFHGVAYHSAWVDYYKRPESPLPLPFDVLFGDGTPINEELTDALFPVYRAMTVSFPWRTGDVMFVDNLLAAHGRSPYTGERNVQVALFDRW